MTTSHQGAHCIVYLLVSGDALTERVRGTVRLAAAPDGKSVLLIDVD